MRSKAPLNILVTLNSTLIQATGMEPQQLGRRHRGESVVDWYELPQRAALT
jgi:hypothetical protein